MNDTVGKRLSGSVIEAVDVYTVRLPTLREFSIAGGRIAEAGGTTLRVLVRVRSDGEVGWGEATPTPRWTYETAESLHATLERYLGPAVLGQRVWDLDALAVTMDQTIAGGFSTGMPLAKSALDMAVHDLIGKMLGVPVSTLWGQRRTEQIPLGWIVSAADGADLGECVAEGAELGYRGFKVKVGHKSLAHDVETVAAVRAAAGDDAAVWVDANQAFTVTEALALANAVQPFGVTTFEQPLRANDIVGMSRLHARSPLPLALDESLRHPSDLLTFVISDAVDVAIAKVQRNSGLLRSRRLCQLAEDCGVALMGSGLTDTDLGFAASLHLFAAFGIDRPVDLNGRQFVQSSYVADRTVEVVDGMATVPAGPGLGVEVDEDAVAELAVDLWH